MPRVFKLFTVVGARPNMMKIAPVMAEMRKYAGFNPILVHTGQHYDYAMSQVFLEQLKLGEPDYNLQVGSGSHHAQTAEVTRRFGELVAAERPDMIIVAGDVNSTMACALVGAKEVIPVAHIESGLRSRDRTMPEEINRLITDAVADLLFITEESARDNLLREGIPPERIHFVGNVMIDSLLCALPKARSSPILRNLGVEPKKYAVLTLHRPSNVDDLDRLYATLTAIATISRELPVVFPIHPRTLANAAKCRIPEIRVWDGTQPLGPCGVWTMPPASYIDFLCLVDSCAVVITDSGGIQEETTYLGVPCLTFRNNTERPITVSEGTNLLIGNDPGKLVNNVMNLLKERSRTLSNSYTPPRLWDGRASKRIVEIIKAYLNGADRATVAATDLEHSIPA